jgi:hypothetical protein
VEPVTFIQTFTQLVNNRSQQFAREDMGLDLIGQNGIDIIHPNGKQSIISLHVDLSGNISSSPSILEFGQVITSVVLNWSYNKSIISQSLNNGIGVLNPILTTYTHSPILINSNTTYTLTSNDGYTTITPSANITYYHRRYWGVSTNSSLTSTEIKLGSSDLSNSKTKNITFDCTGGRRFWYAYPASFGYSNVTVNGFPFSGWIGGTYPQTISITNSYGYTENYYYYMVNNIQNGSSISTAFA